jgi:hypothetical protein
VVIGLALIAVNAWLEFWGWFALLPYCFTGCQSALPPSIFIGGSAILAIATVAILDSLIRRNTFALVSKASALLTILYGVVVTAEWLYAVFSKGDKMDSFSVMAITSPIPTFLVLGSIWIKLERQAKITVPSR